VERPDDIYKIKQTNSGTIINKIVSLTYELLQDFKSNLAEKQQLVLTWLRPTRYDAMSISIPSNMSSTVRRSSSTGLAGRPSAGANNRNLRRNSDKGKNLGNPCL
jgi:hypothetical protein